MMLALEDLAFGYPRRTIGTGISFTVDAGTVVALLGPNGGGKTTLFKTVLGLLRPHGGSVHVDGADTATWSRQRLARAVAFVPQTHLAYFPFRVIDVVVMGRSAHLGTFSAPRPHDLAIALRALERLGVGDLADRIYTEISGGERQLVLIARALAQEARLIVMDEPTASLDFGNQVRVLGVLRQLAMDGLGVLFSTHDPDHAFLCADDAALLHGGRLLRFGPPRAVVTTETLRLLYGIDAMVVDLEEPAATLAVPLGPAGPRGDRSTARNEGSRNRQE
jgi:iron complex transport system ATP-binding protein